MKGILNKLLLVAVVCGVVEANAARSLQNLQKAFGNYVATGVSAAQQVAKHKVKLGVGAVALAVVPKYPVDFAEITLRGVLKIVSLLDPKFRPVYKNYLFCLAMCSDSFLSRYEQWLGRIPS